MRPATGSTCRPYAMAKAFLLDPQAAVARLRVRYRNQCRTWLTGDGEWPLSVPLGPPSERDALNHLPAVRAWQEAWQRWPGPGRVEWIERRWPVAGAQRLPRALCLKGPDEVAEAIDAGAAWRRCRRRFEDITARWPVLSAILPRHFDLLGEWSDTDLNRLLDLLAWLEANPDSGLYPRQLPVGGLDSKWLGKRQAIVGDWLRAIRNVTGECDFHQLTGLARPPVVARLRVLDPQLQAHVGGLCDITSPVDELARLELPVQKVFIVENLQTGLAFSALPGAAVFMGQGYAVNVFGQIPWLKDLPCYYWGDLDTHGFAILSRLRHYLPRVTSILMDESTLLTHRALWTEESKPVETQKLPALTAEEQEVYDGLRKHRWQPRIRLEQERIPWPYVCRTIGHL